MMAETREESSSANVPPVSVNAAEQARVRKERREAKLRQNAGARLNKITGLGGGIRQEPNIAPAKAAVSHADPAEVDISEHHYQPQVTHRNVPHNANPPSRTNEIDEDALRQMMLGTDPTMGAMPGGNRPFAGLPGLDQLGLPGAGDDSMMKILQQMMGNLDGGGAGGMPPFPGMPGKSGLDNQSSNTTAYLWRIIHTLFALSLGLYAAFATTYSGTRIERELSSTWQRVEGADVSDGNTGRIQFFWIFATVELILQTTRFLAEKGRIEHGGMLGTISALLPEPYRGYLAIGTRYSRIWTTISGDALVVVFVLGACSWVRGA